MQTTISTGDIFKKVIDYAELEDKKIRQILGLLLRRCSERQVALLGMIYITNIQKIHAETYLTVYDCKLGRETYSKQKKIVVARLFQYISILG